MEYGQYIEWHDFWGRRSSMMVQGHDGSKEAYQAAIQEVEQMGWPGWPKWWQWWRWRDTKAREMDTS